MPIQTAQWKRYPSRSGASRFAAYYVSVEILEKQSRTVTKCNVDPQTGKAEQLEVKEEWSRIRVNGRSKWVPSKELSHHA